MKEKPPRQPQPNELVALDAGTFQSENVKLGYDGVLFIFDQYNCVRFSTPETIESLYLQLKKALNK